MLKLLVAVKFFAKTGVNAGLILANIGLIALVGSTIRNNKHLKEASTGILYSAILLIAIGLMLWW